MAQGYARIDSRLDTAKIGSAGRVEVHRVRLLAVIGVRKTFPHGLGQNRKSAFKNARSALPPGADIPRRDGDVRLVPLPDSCGAQYSRKKSTLHQTRWLSYRRF